MTINSAGPNIYAQIATQTQNSNAARNIQSGSNQPPTANIGATSHSTTNTPNDIVGRLINLLV